MNKFLTFAAGCVLPVAICAAEAPHAAAPMMVEPGALQQAQEQETKIQAAEFGRAYVRAGKPRMAIFFNRSLSDDVEEWKTPVRIETAVVNRQGDVMQAETAVHFRSKNSANETHQPKSLVWAFEDGFYSTFLAKKVRLVDRRVMLRLAADQRPENAKAMAVVKHIEMDGLTQYADVLVELLIQRNANSPTGYNFKAQATSVKSAQVLAMINANDIEPAKGRFVAGPNGYERPTASADPEYVKQIGAQLAQRLMASLSTSL